jgi:hypothetical protein
MIKRIALSHSASFSGAPVLARPERVSDRLLVWVWRPGGEAGGAAFIDAYVSEGWNVLEIGCPASDNGRTAAAIVDAAAKSRTRGDGVATIFIADRGTATAVAQAIILGHRDRLIAGRCGLVTTDAFAEDEFPAVCGELAEIENLATIWAVDRGERKLRQQTFKHHAMLQERRRETHFLVLPDPARSLAQQLIDSRNPLGREARWLLDPVHSRSS